MTDDALLDRVADTVERVAGALAGRLSMGDGTAPSALEAASLFVGVPGVAIAQLELAQQLDDGELLDAAAVRIAELPDCLALANRNPGLSHGLAGVGWSLAHLARAGAIELDAEVLEPIDSALAAWLARPGEVTFDLMFGAAGLVLYLLERPRDARGDELLAGAVRHLLDSSGRPAGGRAWRTLPDPRWTDPEEALRFPEGRFVTGVAHGTAGVAAALGAASSRLGDSLEVRPVVTAALDWVWDNRAAVAAEWPGWCAGVAGLAGAGAMAAQAIGDDERAARFIEAGLRAAAETPGGSPELGVCHGLAGRALVWMRLFDRSGDDRFAAAAARELARVLDALDEGDRLSRCCSGLYNGLAGIGLVLLAATGEQEPSWDRLLALSSATDSTPR